MVLLFRNENVRKGRSTIKHLIKKYSIPFLIMFLMASCSSADQPPPEEYVTWRQDIHHLFGNRLYRLPPFDPEVGPLKMVYEISDRTVSFGLYRWDQFEITTELAGPHTPHDLYYSFTSNMDGEARWDGHTNSLLVHEENGITIYQNAIHREKNKEIAESLVTLLKKHGIEDVLAEIIHLERRIGIDLYASIDQIEVKISFYIHHVEELEPMLSGIFASDLNQY